MKSKIKEDSMTTRFRCSIPHQELKKPHPVAYARAAHQNLKDKKSNMMANLVAIRQLQARSEETGQKLFAKGMNKWKQKSLIDHLDYLDKEEEKHRNSFELMRSLQQLEHILVRSYWACRMKDILATVWNKHRDGLRFEGDKWAHIDVENRELAMKLLFIKEEKLLTQKSKEALAEHEAISKEIKSWMCDSSKPVDEWSMENTIMNYIPCLKCEKVYNNSMLLPFGEINEKECDDAIIWAFHCYSCADPSMSKCDFVCDDTPATPSTPTKMDLSHNAEQNMTSKKKRKKRKKKKKKKSIESSTPSCCSSEDDGSELTELKTPLGKGNGLTIELNESNEGKNNVHVSDSSCFDTGTPTTETSFSSSATPDSSEYNVTSVEEDLNELFVEYLWQTGSMIALDKYMDEMDKAPRNASHL